MLRFATAVGARIRFPWLPTVVGVFAASRVAYALAGVRFDDSALHPATVGQVQWQLLPTKLLSHDLGTSVWNLHSQPPLYNLFCGALLHLPTGWQRPVAQSVYMALGLLLAITTFMLMDELGTSKRWAFAVTVLVVANPAVVLYENWLSWSYPTAVLLTAGAYCLLRWARTRRARWAAATASSFSAVVLIDATFQWPWLLAMTAIVVVVSRRHWRRVLCATAIPLALVATWYAKDAAQVGTPTTSSWLGMNLYQTTLGLAPASDLRSLTRQGTLDTLSEVPAFQPVSSYAPRFTREPHTGVAATEVRSTRLGVPNFNNAVYTRVSVRYLDNDLAYIRARPARYASAVALATQVWSMPADQYEWLARNYSHISGYAGVYDRAVLLQAQPGANSASIDAEVHGARPPASTIAWGVVAVTLFDLLLAPLALLIGRANRVWLACGAAMWSTVAYSFVVTSLTEVGENMRFRVELGSVPVVLALLTLTVLLTRVKQRAHLPAILGQKFRFRTALEGVNDPFQPAPPEAPGRVEQVQIKRMHMSDTDTEQPRVGVGAHPAHDLEVAEHDVEQAFLGVVDEGRRRLYRPWIPLLATGAVGGVDVGTGVLALILVEHETGSKLLGGLAFSIGFIALTLARSELFTEDFLIPVSTVIARQARARMLIRLWVGTLIANLAAGWVITWFIIDGFPESRRTAVEAGYHYVQLGLGGRAFSLAILGGAVITLMTWMQHSTDAVASKIVAAVLTGFLLGGAQLNHAIVNSLLMFSSLHTGHAPFGYLQWAETAGWATLGNLAGGIGLVTVLRLLQVPHKVANERANPAPGVPLGDSRRRERQD